MGGKALLLWKWVSVCDANHRHGRRTLRWSKPDDLFGCHPKMVLTKGGDEGKVVGSQHHRHDEGRFLIVTACERRARTADRSGWQPSVMLSYSDCRKNGGKYFGVFVVVPQVSWRLSPTAEERNSSQRISHHSRIKELVASW